MQEKRPMYLLTYDHGGYILWGPHFQERLESAVDWLEKYPSFKLGLDNEAFAYDEYEKTQPEMMEYLREKLERFKGRFAIGSSTYGQPLSVFINEESNVRQLTYAIRTNLSHFGQTPKVFAISEHALHSQIPQLIAGAGYEAALLRTHFMMYGYNPTCNAPYVLWQGDDGTRVPAVPTYPGEGAEFAITTMDNWTLTRWPDQTSQSLEDYRDAFPHIDPLLASRYDDIVLRCEALTAYVEERRDQFQWILLEEIPGLFGPAGEVFAPGANDFVVRMPWGYCGNLIFNRCRQCELNVLTAERLNAWAVLAGGESRQHELEESWKALLVSQHHDIQICGLLDDAALYTGQSLECSAKVMRESLDYLAKQFTTGEGSWFMAYNPLSFPAEQAVSFQAAFPRGGGGEGISLWHAGQEIPCEYTVLDYKDKRITRAQVRFTSRPAPMGICCYEVRPVKGGLARRVEPRTAEKLQCGGLTLELDKGGIRSLKVKDKVFFDLDEGRLFAGVIDGAERFSEGAWRVVETGSEAVGEYNGFIGSIGIRFTLALRGDGLMRCDAEFTHHGEKIGRSIPAAEFKLNTNGFRHEEKLRFLLPIQLSHNAEGVRDLPFVIEETKDKYIQGNYWTACSDGEIGAACFNMGSMCLIREDAGLSVPLAYANDYVWGARMLYGSYRHQFAILPFTGAWQEKGLHCRALAYAFPVGVHPVEENQRGPWQDSVAFISADCSENILLSALYPEDGRVIARFYEYKGEDGRLSLSSGFGSVSGQTDLLGNPLEGGTEGLCVTPHKILSFSIERDDNNE